jgi:serine/threonine protein kinase
VLKKQHHQILSQRGTGMYRLQVTSGKESIRSKTKGERAEYRDRTEMSSFGLWECAEEEPEYHSTHAELTYDDVAEAGSPSRPLDFPAPTVSRCSHVDLRARDHRSGTVHLLRNVIMRSGVDTSGNRSNIGYLIKKKMAKTTYGSIRLCIVLKRISRSKVDLREDRQDRPDAFDPEFVEWESTDTLVVIKRSEWYKIHSMRGRHLEDPIKEIGALQLLGSYHPHVQGARDALQDDNNLYAVMTYLPGGDLYGRLVEHDLPIEQKGSEFYGFAESRGRVWFRQLLQVRSDGSITVTSIG